MSREPKESSNRRTCDLEIWRKPTALGVYWIPALARSAHSAGMTESFAPMSGAARHNAIQAQGWAIRGYKVIPIRIGLLDELNLSGAIPFLQLLLPADGFADIIVWFVIDESVYPILLREPVNQAHLMLVNSPNEIVGDANVQRAAELAGKDIDPMASLGVHIETTVFTGSSAFADDDRKIVP